KSGEKIVSCENSMGIIQSSQGVLKPISEHLLSEVAIVCELAKGVFGDIREREASAEAESAARKEPRPPNSRAPVDWDSLRANYDLIRDHIEHVVSGFENYNQRVREPGGFYLPNAPRDRQEFPTENGKAIFFVHPIA